MVARTLLMMLLAVGTTQAQVYKWTDKDGKVHYGERPPAANSATLKEAPSAPPPAQARSTTSGVLATQSPKPAGAKSTEQQEAEFQSRRAARQRAEDQQAKASADAKARASRQRIEQANEDVRKMREGRLQGDRAANRRRSQDPDLRQRDVNRAYDDAWRRRRAGESTDRSY